MILRGGHHGAEANRLRRPGGRPDTAEGGVPAFGSGGRWALVNISAAVARQFDEDRLPLAAAGLADPPVRTVVLTDAQLEHISGLLALRSGAPIDLYATPAVFEELSNNLPVLPALQHYCGVHWRVIPVAGDRQAAAFRVESLPMLEFIALAAAARPLPHAAPHRQVVGDHIALVVRDLASGCQVFCAPGLGRPGPLELEWMQRCDAVLLGATPLDQARGAAGLDWVQELPARLKVMLVEADAVRAQALAGRGIEVAHDGMEFDL
jgi:pyrroloquinoline quinone biosynthesis protein B